MLEKEQPKILLIASYPNLASLYRNVLEEEGYEVFIADNEGDAETIISKEQVGLVVVDESPPRKDTSLFMRKIRQLLPHPHIVLCSLLDEFKYDHFCSDSFSKTSDITILQNKIKQLSMEFALLRRIKTNSKVNNENHELPKEVIRI